MHQSYINYNLKSYAFSDSQLILGFSDTVIPVTVNIILYLLIIAGPTNMTYRHI